MALHYSTPVLEGDLNGSDIFSIAVVIKYFSLIKLQSLPLHIPLQTN